MKGVLGLFQFEQLRARLGDNCGTDQAVANMAMVCGLLPVIGVPLSFISYGGTSLIVTLAAVGLVISVYRKEIQKSFENEKDGFLVKYFQLSNYIESVKLRTNDPITL